jgi:OHS family lactose permease-like MFS transporter
VLYLVGFQFASQVGASIISPIAGKLYDSIGFRQTYLIMGVTVLCFTILSIFTLLNSKKTKGTNQYVNGLEKVV